MRGIDTARYDAGKPGAVMTAASSSTAPDPKDLLTRNACVACHGLTTKIVGPGFSEIASKYNGRADAESYLTKKVREGGQGVWGSIPMPPQAAISESDAGVIARWLVSGAK